jgi:transposase
MGRKRIEIDQHQFEQLCYMQCTLDEIAGWFGCSEDTIQRWCKRTYRQTFGEVYAGKSQGGRISLRRAQFELAKKSPAMAIWLGKQYLGQSDAPQDSSQSSTAQNAAQSQSVLQLVTSNRKERRAASSE